MEWTQKTLFERIKERWNELDYVYTRLQDAREHICDFFRPDLGVDYDETHDMLMLGGDITEGSGPWVARTASTQFQGNTVSKKLDWFDYGFSDDRLNGIDELDRFRQDLKTHNSNVYQRGNFYDVQPQFTLDGWTIGSPLMFMEEEEDKVMCLPVHWLTYRIFYDRFNRTEGVIIKDKQWTAKKCFDKFCPGTDIQKRLKKAEEIFTTTLWNNIKNGKLNEKVTIWRAVFKDTDPVWGNFEKPYGKKWVDVYFEDLVLKEKQDKPLLKTGYFSKPYVHWDFDKKTWESASRTPAFYAIYDNLSLVQIFRNFLDNTQMKVRPPYAALLSYQDRLDMRPGAPIFLKQNEWNYRPTPFENTGDVRFEKDQIEIFRENLSRHFHLEMFRMFTDIAQQKNQEFKVLHLIEIAGERVTQLLPAIEAHENYLYQVDERVRSIELAAGRGPYNRRNIENIIDIIEHYIGGDTVKIEPQFVGTLRQAQQRQQKIQPLQFGIGALSEIAAAMGDPNFVRFMLKGYETGDKALQAVSFPQDLINEKQVFDRMYQEYQQLQAQREQFAQMVELLKAGKGQPMLEGAVA